jgi:hypothetical protein
MRYARRVSRQRYSPLTSVNQIVGVCGGALHRIQQPIRGKAVEAPPKRITVSSGACSFRRSRNECQVRERFAELEFST